MSRPKMHPDQVETDVDLVRHLVTDQFPQWADLPIQPVESYGTNHAIYRLGEEFCARLPYIAWATRQAAQEAEWLPRLAPHLPLALPVQVAMGHPIDVYPFDWSIYRWLPGDNANGTAYSPRAGGEAGSAEFKPLTPTNSGPKTRYPLRQS